ncbi:MAG: hypothetical protein Crog4KO_35360 [Crocinitomicaceae bacterium]
MLSVETQWTYDRIQLFKLRRRHPNWSYQKLADYLGYSLSWVKKWLKRFQDTKIHNLSLFSGESRAPKNPAHKVTPAIRDVILSLRHKLSEEYGRVTGAKTILYHLHHDGHFGADEILPSSHTTIWRVLKDAGYIPKRVKNHIPLDPTPPMQEWEFDFGEVRIAKDVHFEIAPLIDRGTSILIDVPHKQTTYQADTTLEMLIEVFRNYGYPDRLRFDRDSRLIGSVGMDDFPSALMRFAWCIGIEPIVCPPRRPDKKGYVERVIRTLKYECLYIQKPATLEDATTCLETYQHFYNYRRAHQGISCNNQPPMIAHTDLPTLRQLPKRINPDAWLDMYNGEVYKRQVSSTGSISIDNHRYQVGREFALKVACVHLDALNQVFHVTVGNTQLPPKPIQGLHHQLMDFDDYADLMITEARAIARQQKRS